MKPKFLAVLCILLTIWFQRRSLRSLNLGWEKVKIALWQTDKAGRRPTGNKLSQGRTTAPQWLTSSSSPLPFSCFLNKDSWKIQLPTHFHSVSAAFYPALVSSPLAPSSASWGKPHWEPLRHPLLWLRGCSKSVNLTCSTTDVFLVLFTRGATAASFFTYQPISPGSLRGWN